MKKDAYFISVMGGMGWGPEDNDYLIKMVNSGRLAGLAIENEHEPSYKVPTIKKGTNVFIPGAYAYYTKEAQDRSEETWMDSIIEIITKNTNEGLSRSVRELSDWQIESSVYYWEFLPYCKLGSPVS